MAEAPYTRLERATAALQAPFALVDLDALRANAEDLERRAGGKPIRLASKSLRCRALQQQVLTRGGFQGTLAFTLPEALWLASHGTDDILVAYPTADAPALRTLAERSQSAAERITVMVDSACTRPIARALSARELAGRRAAVVQAVAQVLQRAGWPPLELVNGGGTGSLERTSAEAAVTEVTAGSGLYGPALFDAYSAFRPRPAALFALPVVRRPGRGVVTALGGGYLASGPSDAARLPQPYLPSGLRLDGQEGAGEVQTPLIGHAADELAIGDRVYLRHAKAGELCERFSSLHLLEGEEIVDEVPTYRGEGGCFL